MEATQIHRSSVHRVRGCRYSLPIDSLGTLSQLHPHSYKFVRLDVIVWGTSWESAGLAVNLGLPYLSIFLDVALLNVWPYQANVMKKLKDLSLSGCDRTAAYNLTRNQRKEK